MTISQVLPPVHTSEDTAFIIEDYPWGFKLRTTMRVWIETRPKMGQRYMSQTINPKTNRWCKPKASTYSDIRVIFKDEKDHVHSDGITFQYADTERSEKFLNNYRAGINEEKINELERYIEARKERGLT